MPDRLFDTASLQPYADKAATEVPWLADDPNAPPARKSGIGWGPYAAALLGNGADLATTLPAIARGGHEANPAMSGMGTAGLVGTKLAGTALVMLAMRALANNHPTAAKALGYGDGAATGAAAIHNATVNQ